MGTCIVFQRLEERKGFNAKDRFLEGRRNSTYDPWGALVFEDCSPVDYSLSNPVFLCIFVFSNLLLPFISSTCQRNNLNKLLWLAGPPSPFTIHPPFAYLEFAAEHLERFLTHLCVLSLLPQSNLEVFLWFPWRPSSPQRMVNKQSQGLERILSAKENLSYIFPTTVIAWARRTIGTKLMGSITTSSLLNIFKNLLWGE